MQTAERVEHAILHVVEAETASSSEIRISAMHDTSPIHTLMFDNEGTLLTANKTALNSLQASSEGWGTLDCFLCTMLMCTAAQQHPPADAVLDLQVA